MNFIVTLVRPWIVGALLFAPNAQAQTPDVEAIRTQVGMLNGTSLYAAGPNDANAVLRALGFVANFRVVTEMEFLFWMDKLCQPTATPEFGDVGVLYTPAAGPRQPSQVYLVIDAKSGLSKASGEPRDMIKSEPISEMKMRAGTALQTVYYRCNPLPDDFYTSSSWVKSQNERLAKNEFPLNIWVQRLIYKDQAMADYFSQMDSLLEEVGNRDSRPSDDLAERRATRALLLHILGDLLVDQEQLQSKLPATVAPIFKKVQSHLERIRTNAL